MTTTPTPDQIAELKAAGYVVRTSNCAMRPLYNNNQSWMSDLYAEGDDEAWSAAWSHYQTQRNRT
jgi:hypothetical protein